ncbi:MAG: PstS family phosphate ABC transporter substrate-binding protein [Actinomycetota bacterium]|nr:PstS family phosphate ABC transporter substrate-binding protein [Actinomycetota bacterium]
MCAKTASKRRRWSLWAVFVTLSLLVAACGGQGGQGSRSGSPPNEEKGEELAGMIRIDGSSTVAPLSETAADLFQQEHPNVQVVVGTTGTGGGFEKFCRNETDVSDASRPIKDSEKQACQGSGVAYEEVVVALDGLANVVSPQADWVNCLTVQELERIWAPDSQVNNWSLVRPGFPDVPISLFGAGTDSGTFDYYTEAILGEEGRIRTDYNATEDDNVTVQGVQGSRGALGFLGLSYVEQNRDAMKALAVDSGNGCVEPSRETVQNGTYKPLSRPLFIYPSREALQRREVSEFIKFYLDQEREIAEAALFVPLTDQQLRESREKVERLASGQR